jgi:hypothetical protein
LKNFLLVGCTKCATWQRMEDTTPLYFSRNSLDYPTIASCIVQRAFPQSRTFQAMPLVV